MSTRALVLIKDGCNEIKFYRHSDGYPSVTGDSLKEFIKGYNKHLRLDAMQSAGWLVIHGRSEYGYEKTTPQGMDWKVGAYEPVQKIPSDVEYLYIIDLEKRILSCRQPNNMFWGKSSLKNTKSCEEFKAVSF
jgi:hypothetical protein